MILMEDMPAPAPAPADCDCDCDCDLLRRGRNTHSHLFIIILHPKQKKAQWAIPAPPFLQLLHHTSYTTYLIYE